MMNVLKKLCRHDAPLQEFTDEQVRKLQKITVMLAVAGLIASVGLISFFCILYHVQSSRLTPHIFSAKQLGATDEAVLLTWSGSKPTEQYIIRYRTDDGQAEVTCETPFAAVRGLRPNQIYDMTIVPVAGGREYPAYTVTCATKTYCKVTQIHLGEVGSNFVELSWEYEGMNNGFVAVAYVLDPNGKRHLTSKKVTRLPSNTAECRIDGLLANLDYTVTVMPMTAYCDTASSNFTTSDYSKAYSKVDIKRIVICTPDSIPPFDIHQPTKLVPGETYKVSITNTGSQTKDDAFTFTLYTTDRNGHLISDCVYPDVTVNPEDKESFMSRYLMLDFTAPKEPGDYTLFLAVDGVNVQFQNFSVAEPV